MRSSQPRCDTVYNPSSGFWVYSRFPSRLDMPRKPPKEGLPRRISKAEPSQPTEDFSFRPPVSHMNKVPRCLNSLIWTRPQIQRCWLSSWLLRLQTVQVHAEDHSLMKPRSAAHLQKAETQFWGSRTGHSSHLGLILSMNITNRISRCNLASTHLKLLFEL